MGILPGSAFLGTARKRYKQILLAARPRVTANFALCRYEMRRRKTKLRSYPYWIQLDPSNLCNLRCPGCATGIRDPKGEPRGFMSVELFGRLLDLFGPQCFSIVLCGWGEPLLNPRFFDFVRMAWKRGIPTWIHSSLNYLTDEMAEECVASRGLCQILVSLDGASQAVYERYRRMGDIEKVKANIRKIIGVRRSMRSLWPLVTWKYLIFEHNADEVEAARRLASECGADAFTTYPGAATLVGAFNVERRYDRISRTWARKPMPPMCKDLWTSVHVNPAGYVMPCCLAYGPEHSFGNVLECAFDDIWNGRAFVNARRLFAEKVPTGDQPHPCNICARAEASQRSLRGGR